MGNYERVQAILNQATGEGTPSHDRKGKFWDLPLQDFLVLSIYGIRVIAPEETPNRGANSGLVIALKGEPPFDGTDFDRMPQGRPPVGNTDIDWIRQWIDDGCKP
jgi:tyrosinase